jgi:hypothetical protein
VGWPIIVCNVINVDHRIVGAILVIAAMDGIADIDSRVGEYQIRPYAVIIGDRSVRCSHRKWSHSALQRLTDEAKSAIILII